MNYPVLIIAGPDELEVGKEIQARTNTLLLLNASTGKCGSCNFPLTLFYQY